MSGKQLLLWCVFAAFLGLTIFTVAEVGYLGFFELAAANWATRLLFVDLTITLSLVAVWMYLDARERGKPFVPYALVTLFFGAAGPLLYLIRRRDAPPFRTTT